MSARNLTVGRWHGCFSLNCAERIADALNSTAFANGIASRLRAASIVVDGAPDGVSNPEVEKLPLGAGIDRKVVNANVWLRIGHGISSAQIDLMVAEAFKAACGAAGASFSVQRIANGLTEGVDLTEFYRTPAARTATGPLRLLTAGGRAVRSAITGTEGDSVFDEAALALVSATYESFTGTPPARGDVSASGPLGTTVAAVSAGRVQDSTTPGRNGASPEVIHLPKIPGLPDGISASAIQYTLIAVGSLVAILIVGYTARGIAGLIREVK